ncbi:MAG: 30S ribosomal protein S21 [bacterium]
MVEFKRKKGENFESFLRRFNKTLIKSRKLKEVRAKQHVVPKRNKNKQKERALTGLKLRAKREYLKKTGKLKEEPKGRW